MAENDDESANGPDDVQGLLLSPAFFVSSKLAPADIRRARCVLWRASRKSCSSHRRQV